MLNVQFSTNLSILVQIVTGLVSILGIFIPLGDKHLIIRDILILETFVQIIELFFYFYFLRSMASTALSQMASIRYFDWVITTPTMLLTTIIYFKYQEYLEKDKKDILTTEDRSQERLTTRARSHSRRERLTFWNFIKENKQNIILIFISNFLMLVFGYLGEIQVISMGISLLFGFIFFGYTFYLIYTKYAINSKQSQKLFYFILFIWGLYGIAAIQNVENKNNMFNILDIFAKNFFGIYLYLKILSVKKSTTSSPTVR